MEEQILNLLLENPPELLSDSHYHEYLNTINTIDSLIIQLQQYKSDLETPDTLELIALTQYKINMYYDLLDFIELQAIDKTYNSTETI